MTNDSTVTVPDNQQIAQEEEYGFPYHYVPTWDGRHFSQTKTFEWGCEYLSYLHFLLDHVQRLAFQSLLDVGCGDGRFLCELSRRVGGKKLAGLDYSRRAIDFAKIMTARVELRCGDIRNSDTFAAPFDVITLIETLEHIPPPEVPGFLGGIHRCLADQGTFILTVPSNNVAVLPKHYQHFGLRSLTEALEPWFEISQVYYLNRATSGWWRFFRKVLINRLFLLNNRTLLRWIYRYYMAHCLHANEKNCRRLAAVCRKRRAPPPA
jgi:SAM-dependent methyltransferase